MMTKIYLPAIRSALLNGLRLSFGIAATGVLLAETSLHRAAAYRAGHARPMLINASAMPQMYAAAGAILVVLLVDQR